MKFTPRGEIALPAPTRLHYDFQQSAALPAGVTTEALTGNGAGASYTVLDPLTTPGGININTAGASSSRASVYAPTLDLSQYKAVRLRYRFDTKNTVSVLAMQMVDDAAVRGAGFGKYASAVAGNQIRAAAASVSTYVNTFTVQILPNKSYDLSLLVDCVTKDIYTMQGDQVTDFWPGAGAALELGLVTPTFRIANSSTTSFALSTTIRSITIDKWV